MWHVCLPLSETRAIIPHKTRSHKLINMTNNSEPLLSDIVRKELWKRERGGGRLTDK